MLNTVRVPKEFELLFEKAQELISKYFQGKREDPTKGTIDVHGERYVLIRAGSMSVDFFEVIKKLYEKEGVKEAENIARQILFDVSHAIGRQDARHFCEKLNLTDPVEKLSIGPIHFSHAGWAFVDLFPESRPSPDEDFYLVYDHVYSFESAAWLAVGKKSDFPVCIMNAGYSSGWCQECFGVALVASEIMCKAKGDDFCRFVMATPSRIGNRIADFIQKRPELANKVINYEVPGFFKHKQIQELLRDSEEGYRVLVEAANDAIIVLKGPYGRISRWNRKAEELFGYTAAETDGKELHQLIVPERYRQKAYDGLKRFFETGEGDILGKTLEVSALRKDGSEFPVELSIASMRIKGKWEATGIIRDITERKRAEASIEKSRKQLMVSQRLAGIGQLTDGVCHEILNPLNIIALQAQVLSRQRSNDPNLIACMEKVKQQIRRVKKITDALLLFSYGGTEERRLVQIEAELDSALSLVEKDFQLDNIRIVKNFEPGLPEICVNPGEMKQAFLNIVSNAKDAMPGGGTLTISVGKTRENNVDLIRIKFSDTGVGIKKENLENIFNPFFSSKLEGKGMGMGLPVTHTLVEKNGGTIGVESEEGKGTTFIIDLPVNNAPPEKAK